MKYEIGSRIKSFRDAVGLSQKGFANLIGVSNSRVSNWEQGINRPDVDLIAKICLILHISADELLGVNSTSELRIQHSRANFTPAITRITEKLPKLKGTQLESIEKRIDIFIEDNETESREVMARPMKKAT